MGEASATDQEAELLRELERVEQSGTSAQLANALDRLAIHYHERRSYARAVPYYRRALGLWREILGQEHPTVGTLLVNLGQVHLHLGEVAAAAPLLKQALGIFERDPDFGDAGVIAAFEHLLQRLRGEERMDLLGPEGERFEGRVRQLGTFVQAAAPAYSSSNPKER